MIYLDNAATTCPKPLSVRKAVAYAMTKLCANPGRSGHTVSRMAEQTVYDVREKAAAFFHCQSSENVIFTKNCTEALNTAIRGIIPENSHVIASVYEHNSALRPLESLKREKYLCYNLAPVFDDDDETLFAFKRLIKPNTRAIICTHASNVFGTVLPVEKLGRLAYDNGLIFIVDAAQTAGVVPIDMQKIGIDALCMPGHKGLYGPMGTGCLLLKDGVRVKPLTCGGTGSYSSNLSQPDDLPDRLESGTLNVPGIAGLGAGFDFVAAKGANTIRKHEQSLIARASYGLKQIPGVQTYGGNTILSFTVDGMHSENVAMLLSEAGVAVRGGFHCAYTAHEYRNTDKTGTVRVSPGAFNTKEEMDLLVKNVGKIAKRR